MKINLPPSSLKKIIVATVLGAFVVGGVVTRPIYAQQGSFVDLSIEQSTLTAIPTRLGDDQSVKIKPGEIKQVEVRVVNSGSKPMTVASEAVDFTVGEDGATPIPITETVEGSNRWSLSSWLTLTPNEQTLRPGQMGVVNVLIQVPEDALPGGHYAMITHRPSAGPIEGGTNQAASAINQRVGTLLYVVVDGPINEEAYITNFIMPKYVEFGPVPYSFTVDNRSDIHITPQMGITIKNMFGRTVETIQPETKNVFPFTSRQFEGEWKRVWGFGRYQAELVMSYGQQNQGKVVIAKTAFWLIPIKLVIASIIVLLSLIAMIISIRRHILHRKQDQSARIAELERQLQSMQKEKLQKFEE